MDNHALVDRPVPLAASQYLDPSLKNFVMELSPGYLLRRNHQRAHDIYLELVGPDGPTRQQVSVLLALAQHEGISQRRVTELTGLDKSTLKEMLGRLISRGLVGRRRNKRDSRAWELTITTAGVNLLNTMAAQINEAQQKTLEPLPEALREVFIHCLRLLIDEPLDATMLPGAISYTGEPERA